MGLVIFLLLCIYVVSGTISGYLHFSSRVHVIGSNATVTCSVKSRDKYCSAKLILPGNRVILGVKNQGNAEVEVQLRVGSGVNLVDCQALCDHCQNPIHLDRGELYGGELPEPPRDFKCLWVKNEKVLVCSWLPDLSPSALIFKSALHAHRSDYAEKQECGTSGKSHRKVECSLLKNKDPKKTFDVWLETTNVLGSTNSSILSIIPQYQWRPKLTVKASKRNSIKLTKKIPKSLKSCELMVCGSFGNKTITVSGKKPDVVLGLDADQDYQLRLMCCGNMINEQQYLCESEWVTGRTQEDVPRRPLSIWRKFLSSRQDQQTEVKVLWKSLSRADARGIVVNYTISISHCHVSSGNLCEDSSNNLDKKMYSIPGNYTELSVSVPANNLTSICVFAWTSAGFSPSSCLLIRPLHMSALPKPRSLSAQLENNSLIVNWQSPSDGEPALGYTLDWPGGWQRYPPYGRHHALISDILLIYPINVSVCAMHGNGQSAAVSTVIRNTEAMQVVVPFLLAVLFLVVVLATIMIQRKRLRAVIWPQISDPVHCTWLQDMLAGKPLPFEKSCLTQGIEEVQFCTLSVDPLCKPQAISPICHANNKYSNLDQSVMSGNYVVTLTYDGKFSSYYNLQA